VKQKKIIFFEELPPESPKTHPMKFVMVPEAWPSVQTTIQALMKMGHKDAPHPRDGLSRVHQGAGLPIPDTPPRSIQVLADC